MGSVIDSGQHGSDPRSEQTKRNERKEPHPRAWWQWVLVYPTLAITLVSAVPTFYELYRSFHLDVPFGQSAEASEQNRLWQQEFECVRKIDLKILTNEYHVQIGSDICPSGNILLMVNRPEWDNPQYRWLSWAQYAATSRNSTLPDLFAPAHAAESTELLLTQSPRGTILCQRWLDTGKGLLLQRIETPHGCFDQVINTYTGWVISSQPAACTPDC